MKRLEYEKAKVKRYTKKEIAEARARGDRTVSHALAGEMLSGGKMPISEAHEAAGLLRNSRPEDSISKVDLATIPQAQNFIFIDLFLAYYQDLDGRYGITKFSGELADLRRVASIEERKRM